MLVTNFWICLDGIFACEFNISDFCEWGILVHLNMKYRVFIKIKAF